MLALDANPRKRSRNTVVSENVRANRIPNKKGPLNGVVACLTGFYPEEKEHIHDMIHDLGGRCTRELNSIVNTHLIAREPRGEKYETALSFENICIVSESWVEECTKANEKVDEKLYLLTTNNDEIMNQNKLRRPLEDEIEKLLLQSRDPDGNLFVDCQFYLVGFPDDPPSLYNKLGKLIRFELGTIFYEIHDFITHIIVNDDTDESMRKQVDFMALKHPNAPFLVSPWWILSSIEQSILLKPTTFPPSYKVRKPLEKTEKPSKERFAVQSNLFRESVFVLLRSTPGPSGVDYDTKELEVAIKGQCGQLMTQELLGALHADRVAHHEKRKCYVLCWGGYLPAQLAAHPLLMKARRDDVCDVVETTPIWFHTCCLEQKVLPSSHMPSLFVPTSWPMRRIVSASKGTEKAEESTVRVSVTGFSGARRTAIVHTLELIGAQYDDSMRTSTTHLICQQASGLKYEKAVEWKIPAVTVDWLLYISRHGFTKGCEHNFAVKE